MFVSVAVNIFKALTARYDYGELRGYDAVSGPLIVSLAVSYEKAPDIMVDRLYLRFLSSHDRQSIFEEARRYANLSVVHLTICVRVMVKQVVLLDLPPNCL